MLDMLSCVYGDSAERERYSNILDMLSDLNLMMDRPKFLQGLDMNKLSSTGLQLDQIVISREKELETIRSCYK
jgi:hypothetical protein